MLKYKIIIVERNKDIHTNNDNQNIQDIVEIEDTKTKRYRSKGEEICCKTMQEIYGLSFGNHRPDFLKNPETGHNLEIDCYNPHIKIGVEYNGIQHYVWPNYTKQSLEQFRNQLRRDKYKLEECDKNGYYLIRVPYTIKHRDIPNYIRDRIPQESITYHTSHFSQEI